jgi:hypothetical protein
LEIIVVAAAHPAAVTSIIDSVRFEVLNMSRCRMRLYIIEVTEVDASV